MTTLMRTKLYANLITLIILMILLPMSAHAQWSQYQGNAAHTGYVANTVNISRLSKSWETTFTSGRTSKFYNEAVVSNKGVFIVAYVSSSSYNGFNLISINPLNGSEQWRTPFHSYTGLVSAPSLSEDTIYVHRLDVSGSINSPYLMGVDAETGSVRFTTTHEGQYGSGSRPTVLGNQVVALGGYYGGIDSYNVSTGTREWFTRLPQQHNFIPAMDEQSIYIYYGAEGGSPGPPFSTFYAIDRQSGQVQYTIQNPSDLHSTHSSISSVMLGGQNDAIIIGKTTDFSLNLLTSFNLEQRVINWTRNLNPVNALAVADGMIVVPTIDSLKMIDEATGSDLWTWAAPAGVSLSSNVIMTNNFIFVASVDTIFAIDRVSGKMGWSEFVGGDVSDANNYSLAYYNGTLYASGANYIIAFSEVPEPSGLLVGAMGIISTLGCIILKRRCK